MGSDPRIRTYKKNTRVKENIIRFLKKTDYVSMVNELKFFSQIIFALLARNESSFVFKSFTAGKAGDKIKL